jgi:hypothetical protein
MGVFKLFVYFLVLIKTLFILAAIYEIYLKKKGGSKKTIAKLSYWKDRFEFVFVVGVAIILIIFFTPLKAKIPFIDFEVKLLFFFLGWILLITADWAVFSKESKMFKNLQAITGSP